jgi:mono/diheme cytochrome c family protein
VTRSWRLVAAAALLSPLSACETRPAPIQGFDPGPVPAEFSDGERRYNENCSGCHGPLGSGTEEAGPPLVHRIYEPSHHSDAAFQLAVTRGVRAHHWTFGNMPPLPALDSTGIAEVTAYVRWLQRHAGIQ